MKNSIILSSIKALIIASFFTPLFVSSAFIFPFVFPKTALFQIIVEVIFFLWLALIVKEPRFRPSRSKITWSLSIFLAMVFIASILGVNFQLSFWSSYERMTGIITMLHYFAFFLVLSSVLKTKKDWLSIFNFFLVAGVLLSLFGVGQKLNLPGFALSGEGRVSGTFGNPAYFAAYLLFSLFLAAFMFFQHQNKKAKIYFGGVFALIFLILFWTETRGALLAFGVSLILFLLALLFWPKEETENQAVARFKKKFKKIALAILVFFAIFVLLILFFKNTAFVRSSGALSRLTSISFNDTTTQTRLLAWRMSLKGLEERPIFGWGWENYNVVFNKFYDPQLFPAENWFDRAHNIVVDTLVTTGIAGFLSYLAIFGAVALVLWRAFRRKRVDFLNAVLFAVLFIGYFIQDLFIFDMLYSYLPFFLVLAFVNWIGGEENTGENKKGAKPSVFLASMIVLAFFASLYYINIRPGLTGYYGIKALTQKGSDSATLAYFKKSLSYNSFGRFESRLQLFETAKSAMQNYDNLKDKKTAGEIVDFALSEGDKSLKERPLDARYLLSIGELDMAVLPLKPERFQAAIDVFEKARQLSPTKQIILFALGEAKVRGGQTAEGVGYFEQAVRLNEKAYPSHRNLVLMYFAVGDKEKGQAELEDIGQRFGENSLDSDLYRRIANIWASQGKYQEAIPFFLKAIGKDPANTDLYASLAANYAQAGDKAKAKETALKILQIDPSRQKDVDAFIQSLGL